MAERNPRPYGSDGFETGDYRHFAPVYLGTESDWIRPTGTVTDQQPIDGKYSLQWSANEDPHCWTLISNSFYLQPPVTISVKVRIDGPRDEPFAGGLGVAGTAARVAGLRLTEEGLQLVTPAWDGEPVASSETAVARNTVYELRVELVKGELTGTLSGPDGEITTLATSTEIEPNALGLYMQTIANGSTTILYDDVTVDAGPYRIPNNSWVRSPQFVVLPRDPDVDEDQGNWVGAPSVIDNGDQYRMWYRIRNNQARGAGYGYAESEDGITWTKAENNPIFVPEQGQDSVEGISVLVVDGVYHAWYTMDANGTWHVAHATSADGVNWEDHGVVIDGYCKDPVALFVDGTYYLYAIAPTNTEISVHTSEDGTTWSRENTIELGCHSHPGTYYDAESETFWLYVFAEEGSASPTARVRRASSSDGISFGPLEATWHDPPVGLDHRPTGGIDYGVMPGDGHGHLPHDRQIPLYYQARHDYRNNRPNWQMAGDGLVVLGARFDGLFVDVPTTIDQDGYAYHAFPMHAQPIRDLEVSATNELELTINEWAKHRSLHGGGTIETKEETKVKFNGSDLESDVSYTLRIGDVELSETASPGGTVGFEVHLPAGKKTDFELIAR